MTSSHRNKKLYDIACDVSACITGSPDAPTHYEYRSLTSRSLDE
jgi:hypothetical protein